MLNLLDMPSTAQLYNHHCQHHSHVSRAGFVLPARNFTIPCFFPVCESNPPWFWLQQLLRCDNTQQMQFHSCSRVSLCSITPRHQGLSSDLAAPTDSLQLCLPCPSQTVWSRLKAQEFLLVAGMYLQESRIGCECKDFSPNRTDSPLENH